jgi:hypothetical protein
MKKYLLLALFCLPAHSETYGLHIASYHTEAGHNNINPGVYVRSSAWDVLPVSVQAGAYKNSLSRATAYAMGNLSAYGATVSLGAGTGYKSRVVPMLALSYRVDHWRLAYVPKFGDINKGHVFHLTYEF